MEQIAQCCHRGRTRRCLVLPDCLCRVQIILIHSLQFPSWLKPQNWVWNSRCCNLGSWGLLVSLDLSSFTSSSTLEPSQISLGPPSIRAAVCPRWALAQHEDVAFLGPKKRYCSLGLAQKQSQAMMPSNGQQSLVIKGTEESPAQAWSELPEPRRFKQSCIAKVKLSNVLFLVPKLTRLTFCKCFFQHLNAF